MSEQRISVSAEVSGKYVIPKREYNKQVGRHRRSLPSSI